MPARELIVSPFLGSHLVVRPGRRNGIKIPQARYAQLRAIEAGESSPDWLADAARHAWGIDVSGRPLRECAILRAPSPLEYGRASYELNMGCNYACKHCYLGLKEFAGLDWPAREQIVTVMRDSGVLWLQLTGGEPTIDKLFPATYARAFELGMMIEILTNGSRLSSPAILLIRSLVQNVRLVRCRPFPLVRDVWPGHSDPVSFHQSVRVL